MSRLKHRVNPLRTGGGAPLRVFTYRHLPPRQIQLGGSEGAAKPPNRIGRVGGSQ